MSERQRILLIDDDPVVAGLVKKGLEKTGDYEVRTEYSGVNSLPAARAFKPDLFLLDVVMPDCDGPDVFLKLRNDAELRNVPVIFLTGTMTEAGLEARNNQIAGCTVVSKQSEIRKLSRQIEKTLLTNPTRG